jgi:hypothetical protein
MVLCKYCTGASSAACKSGFCEGCALDSLGSRWVVWSIGSWASIWLPGRYQLCGCPQLHGLYTAVFISRGIISVELKRMWNKPGMAGFKVLPWDICLEQVIKQWNTSALMTGLGRQNSNLGLLAHETRMLTTLQISAMCLVYYGLT